jgi:hypothetical protein
MMKCSDFTVDIFSPALVAILAGSGVGVGVMVGAGNVFVLHCARSIKIPSKRLETLIFITIRFPVVGMHTLSVAQVNRFSKQFLRPKLAIELIFC